MKRALVAVVLFFCLSARSVHADPAGSGISTPVAFAYVVPALSAALATGVNGALLLYDEPSPFGWRLFGYLSGGAEVAIAVVLFAVGHDTTEGLVLGTVSSVLGVAAIMTAIFVKKPDDIVGPMAVPWVTPHGGGVALTLRF